MNKPVENDNFDERIEKFLEVFMSETYPVKDHPAARIYFRELFQQLIPKYFCVHDKDNGKESINNE